MQTIHENMADEIFRSKRGKRRIKMLDDYGIDPQCLEKLHLVFMSKEHFWRAVGRQNPQRMRLKCQDDRAAAELFGIGDGTFN